MVVRVVVVEGCGPGRKQGEVHCGLRGRSVRVERGLSQRGGRGSRQGRRGFDGAHPGCDRGDLRS